MVKKWSQHGRKKVAKRSNNGPKRVFGAVAASIAALGGCGRALGDPLGRSWAALGGRSWPAWSVFFYFNGLLGVSWGRPGAVLGSLGTLQTVLGGLWGSPGAPQEKKVQMEKER